MPINLIKFPSCSSITTASVWLYLTEKGREKKKKPFKYWMNNSEIYFEVSYVHPAHVFDVPTLLADAYKAFLQSAQVVTYDTERKKDAPVHYPVESCFVNPIIENMNLITWTAMGWTIPFRCTICLPIDKIKYIQLFINGWAIEFTLYAKASSKNKLEAGAPQLFSILGEMQRIMVGQNWQPAAAIAPQPQYYDGGQSHHYLGAARTAVHPAGNFVNNSTDENSVPDYLSPNDATTMQGTSFDPEFGLDPALGETSYESPQSLYTTSDSSDFDSIISNYPEFEEKVKQDMARARENEEDGSIFTEKDRARKRRLQGPASSKEKKKKELAAEKRDVRADGANMKKVKKEPLLVPKKEGDKFTQYYPTNAVPSVKTTPLTDVKVDMQRNQMLGQQRLNSSQGPQPPAMLLQQMTQYTPYVVQGGQAYINPQASGVYHIGNVVGGQMFSRGDEGGGFCLPNGDDNECAIMGGFNPLKQVSGGASNMGGFSPLSQVNGGGVAPTNTQNDGGASNMGGVAPTNTQNDGGAFNMGGFSPLSQVNGGGFSPPTVTAQDYDGGDDPHFVATQQDADTRERPHDYDNEDFAQVNEVTQSALDSSPITKISDESEDESEYHSPELLERKLESESDEEESGDDDDDDDADDDADDADEKGDVVLKRVPVKPVIVQIAERTGMEKGAMEEVIKVANASGDSTAPADGVAIIDKLHKQLTINGKPLKSYDHVLAYTESYSVPQQRNFFFLLDTKNKLRFEKGTSIDVKHETLSYTLHVKEYGKSLVSHTVSGAKSLPIENFAGFIAIMLKDVGLVIFVPYAFNK